jgi:hypothetical protein
VLWIPDFLFLDPTYERVLDPGFMILFRMQPSIFILPPYQSL